MSRASTNRIVHLELHTGDLEQARAFYTALCGWQAEQIETRLGSYLALGLGGALHGGIVECSVRRARWLPYVEVAEINEATDRARALGALVSLEPREGPVGWRSVVSNSITGEMAFWQPKR
jgi:predicted enzyme related to lactoylglutathione lyase